MRMKITNNEAAALSIIIESLSGFEPEQAEWLDGVLYARRVTFDPSSETVWDFIRDAARDSGIAEYSGDWLSACQEILRVSELTS